MNKPSIFSFFAGAGFLDLGFEVEEYDVCFVNENHKPFLDAYIYSRSKLGLKAPRYGHSMSSIECLDQSKLAAAVNKELNLGNLVGFIGGPPCPDFSVAGKNRGKDGENGRLSQVYADLVCEHRPDFFLFENVKGLYRTKKHRVFFEGLKAQFKESGYILHERLVNSIEYGAPQDRERIILLGFLEENLPQQFDWSERVYPDRVGFEFDWPQTREYESGSLIFPEAGCPRELTVEHWFRLNEVDSHPNAFHRFTPRAGLTKFERIAEGDDKKKSYKRLHRWRYSPTAAYGNNEVHVHPYEPRRISVAEALAIQSLPKEFELPADMTLTNMFKTIGNGVPFLAARGLARSIWKHLGASNASYSFQSSTSYPRAA